MPKGKSKKKDGSKRKTRSDKGKKRKRSSSSSSKRPAKRQRSEGGDSGFEQYYKQGQRENAYEAYIKAKDKKRLNDLADALNEAETFGGLKAREIENAKLKQKLTSELQRASIKSKFDQKFYPIQAKIDKARLIGDTESTEYLDNMALLANAKLDYEKNLTNLAIQNRKAFTGKAQYTPSQFENITAEEAKQIFTPIKGAASGYI